MNTLESIGVPLLWCFLLLPQIGVTVYLAFKAKQAKYHSPTLAQNLRLAALLAGVGIVLPLMTALALVVVVRGREQSGSAGLAHSQGSRPPSTWSGFS